MKAVPSVAAPAAPVAPAAPTAVPSPSASPARNLSAAEALALELREGVQRSRSLLSSAWSALSLEPSMEPRGPLSSFLDGGGSFPVLMVACNRAGHLRRALDSLLAARGASKERILVVQDGSHAETAAAARDRGIRLERHDRAAPSLRGGGGARIASHYRFAIERAFAAFAEAPAILVAEEDLLFSPDFFEFFLAAAPVMDVDPSVMAVSAWNDNGRRDRVGDAGALHRTHFFPGLGWLLTRALYEGELRDAWPEDHWDHWLRHEDRRRGRDCVYPEVPRTYHAGERGTFMDPGLHRTYFASIGYNRNESFRWGEGTSGTPPPFLTATKEGYDLRLRAEIAGARHAAAAADLAPVYAALKSGAAGGALRGIVALWDGPKAPRRWAEVAEAYGLWHEFARAEYRGVHRFVKDGVLHLLFARGSPYEALRPAPA